MINYGEMTTPLEKTLKRELTLDGRAFVIAFSPEGLKITLKGKRNGLELRWADLVNGEAALATALHASVGQFAAPRAAAAPPSPARRRVSVKPKRAVGSARGKPRG